MEGFKAIPYIFLVLAVAAVVGGAAAIVLGEFGDSMDDKCINSSFSYDGSARCLNSTVFNYSVNVGDSDSATFFRTGNFSSEFQVVWEGQQGILTVGGQLTTVGIIGIMVIIIGLLAGVFVYFRYFN